MPGSYRGVESWRSPLRCERDRTPAVSTVDGRWKAVRRPARSEGLKSYLVGRKIDVMPESTEAPVDADSDALRTLLRNQASTVTVVTAPGTPAVGFTAT